MQDLKLIGVHEDGEHLLLGGPDGTRFRVRVDEPLRAAVRRDRHHPSLPHEVPEEALRPRDVQALVRAGASTEEAAERAGWTVEKVRRFEGPILAEREHVAGLARSARLRGRTGIAGAPTLAHRVHERLAERGVDSALADWDSRRAEEGPWTVVVMFAAGGRQREASWHFDLADRTVSAADDEARWLSEDEHTPEGPLPAPQLAGPPRTSTVYDVEAEGGLRAADDGAGRRAARAEPVDLMTAMRERSTARLRRGAAHGRGSTKSPTNIPGGGDLPDDALPLVDMGYDPETMGPPPAAHAEPDADGVDGRPEPQAASESATDASGTETDAHTETGTETELPDVPDSDASSSRSTPPDGETATSRPTGAPAPPGQRPRTPRRTGRTSVPAWDEIMFGGKSGED